MKLFLRTLFLFVFLSAMHSSNAQCGGGFTQSQLNWDYLDFLPSANPNYTPSYLAGITPYNQNFVMGTRRINFAMGANITLEGENASSTADAGSFSTAGQDVQFTTTNAAPTTITMTFDAEVTNVRFSMFDLDNSQRVTISATNSIPVAVPAIVTRANAASGIVVVGQQATGPGFGYAGNDNNGTLNIQILGPVRTITLSLSTAAGNIWLSDMNACVTGTFPSNERIISRPFTGMPAYMLTVLNNRFMLVNPANGTAKDLFTDLGHTNMNGMGYDPYKRILYYGYSLTGSPSTTKTLYKYSVDNETITTFVADINAAPLNIPTYTPGITSGSASFYNGSLYFGVESSNAARNSGRENTVWKIDFAADSLTPIRASQVYATRVDSVIGASNRLIHDWSDIGVTNNGMLYDFDGAGGDSMFYHFNMMTGERTQFTPSGPGNIGPKQVAIDWQENVYNMGGLPSIAPQTIGGYIVPYNYNGTVNNAQNQLVNTLPGPVYPTGSWGDCSEAFRPNCDFGDAPASYDPDPLSPAVHEKDTALRIGATWDREFNKLFSAAATGDGGDEDGIPIVPLLSPAAGSYLADVSVYNNTGENATVLAWLDLNNNGVFDAGEACLAPTVISSMPSLQSRSLYWASSATTVPDGSYTYLRVRLVKASAGMNNTNPTGYYNHGETEDYRVLVDFYPLSVNLLSFNAKLVSPKHVELNWKTTGEENFSGFEILRSGDNNNWVSIGFVNAAGNGASAENAYLYNDLNPLKGKSFYKLKLINNDGKYKNSEVRIITIKSGISQITLLPNPASDKAMLQITTSSNSSVYVTITDMNGRRVHKQMGTLNRGFNTIDLPVANTLSSGTYFVTIKIKNESYTQKLIIKKE